MTTVSHAGSEITRGTRSKSESTAVAIFKFFGSEIVLSKVKAHILFFIRKIAYKHKCHFEGGVGERSETANLNATQISNKDMIQDCLVFWFCNEL